MIKHYTYREAHTIVSEITLLELGPSKLTKTLEDVDHFRFTVTGTNSDTGIRQPFSFALISTLTPSQRGALDLPYVYKLVDETVEDILIAYGYFITGHAERGAQFERAFERFILSPGSVAATLADGTRVVFEGRGSVFEARASITDMESDDFKARTAKRPFIIVSDQKVYPYIAEDVPKWGQSDVTLTKSSDLFDGRVEACVQEHYLNSKALPCDRPYPAMLLAQDGEGIGRVVGRIESPKTTPIVVTPKPAIKRVGRTTPKIEQAAIPTRRLAEEEMVTWKQGVRENDQVMRSVHPIRTPWRTGRAVG